MIENSIISDHFTVEELKKLKITPPDVKMYKKIRSNWDSVAKPLDGMGDFELLTAKIGAVLGDENIDISKKAVIMMCADNGDTCSCKIYGKEGFICRTHGNDCRG